MNRGWEILIIKSSLRLIETILEKDIGLLLLDYELEEDNDSNIRLISIIKTTRPRLPIIVLAPDIPVDDRKKLAETGIFYCAFKPVQAAELTEIVKAVDKLAQKKQEGSDITVKKRS